MIVFHSMTNVTIFIAGTAFFLLWVAQKRTPLITAGLFVQEIFTSRKYMLHFAAMIIILLFNKIELSIEKTIKIHADFTPTVFKLEGGFVATVQNLFENHALTWFTAYFYVVVFPALLIVSLGLYTYSKNYKLFYALCYAVMINYMIAIPFYLFFPVNEVWSFHPNVRFLIPDVFPSFEQEYRPLSGLDNCFPSLHTSISVTIAIIALRSNNKLWSRFAVASAVIIIFSIFYLGIHWLTDMIGGFMLGLLASQLGIRISEAQFAWSELRMWRQMKERNASEKW